MTLAWPVTGAAVAEALRWPADRADECADNAAAATTEIESKVGPWAGQQLTHRTRVATAREAIVLPWPVATIESVTRDGTALTVDAGDVDEDAGIVFGDFLAGKYVVTATARAAEDCPAPVKKAALALAVFWTKQDKLGPRLPGQVGSAEKDTDVSEGFALPRRVSEMIRDYVRPGGFA